MLFHDTDFAGVITSARRAKAQWWTPLYATRYDLHGKALLKTNPKEYIVDTGFRTWMAGYRVTDTGRLFENAVYLQLLYEGWSVHVGKLYGKEVDFAATKDGRVLYVQATDEMFASETREREIAPLKSIRDNHEKIVVVRQGSYDTDIDGIRIVSARDFSSRDMRFIARRLGQVGDNARHRVAMARVPWRRRKLGVTGMMGRQNWDHRVGIKKLVVSRKTGAIRVGSYNCSSGS